MEAERGGFGSPSQPDISQRIDSSCAGDKDSGPNKRPSYVHSVFSDSGEHPSIKGEDSLFHGETAIVEETNRK